MRIPAADIAKTPISKQGLDTALKDSILIQPDNKKNPAPFIPNEKIQYRTQSFGANEGIDFYIDYARYLPDNTTATKIIMRAFNRDMVRIIERAEGTPDITESSTYRPYFGFRYEFRLAHFDPTMIVAITIETIDKTTLEVSYLGHSFFPLFLDKRTKMAVIDSSAQGYILQEGNYQVPIYCQKPPTVPPFTYDIFRELDKIPTASLLVRVRRAPTKDGIKVLSIKDVPQREWETTGLVEPPPDYADEKYNTSLCDVNDPEMVMFKSREKRYDPQLRDTLKFLQGALNVPPPAVSFNSHL